MPDCVFCRIVQGQARSWKVIENDSVFAFLDIHPVSEYHTLVIPKKHYENIFDVSESELLEVMKVIKALADLYSRKVGIHHVQIINSSGSEAQQDVFHLHFHIIPRKKGDGQNMRWSTHPEWAEKFDGLLAQLK